MLTLLLLLKYCVIFLGAAAALVDREETEAPLACTLRLGREAIVVTVPNFLRD